MSRIAGRVVFAALVVLGTAAGGLAADRTADEILKDIDALKTPSTAAIQKAQGDERQKLISDYFAAMKAQNQKRAELVGELLKADPTNARLATLLPTRWAILAQTGKADEASAEIADILKSTKDEKLQTEAYFSKAQVALMAAAGRDAASALLATEEFLKSAPKDPRGEQLLYSVAMSSKDPVKAELQDRILKDYPEGRVARMIKGERKQKEGIGKPFDLEFTEATKGKTITSQDLKGKVVVVDFWATWCGPCVAEMPNMKKLYAEYKDKGVEFVGVSLDQPKEQGGLDKLKEFVEKEEIAWPQYYDGKVDARTFATDWGITAIPTVFIVDADGNLYSTEARGKLETLIPELLKKKDAAKGGAGGL